MRAVEAGDVCRHSREGAFLAAAVALAALALPWLGYELFRLLWQPRTIGTIAIHPGAIDFEIFRAMLGDWFAGRPVYTGPKSTVNTYLPASMLLFWPVYGWASRSVALFAWFVATAVALAWLVRCMVRESGAQGKAERAFVALLPLATYPAGAIVGNGQSTLFVLALLLAALVTLRDREPGWGRDLAVALCLLFALVKPTVAAPFVVAAACVDGGFRPVVLAAVAYAATTLLAATAQPESLPDLLRQFLVVASHMSTHRGESNLHRLLGDLAWEAWAAPLSLAILALFAAWTRRHRRADLWLIAGAAAIVARFWSYHRWYDDLLIVVPLVALYRLARRSAPGDAGGKVAGALFIATLVFLLAPGGLYALPAPWNDVYRGVQIALWLAALVVLSFAARTSG